jgi:ubiquitin-like protein Pup
VNRVGASGQAPVIRHHSPNTALKGGKPMPAEKQQERKDKRPQETEEIQPNPEITEKGEEIKEDLDRLLDEIDEILEEDSEEFVENYIQRGGQ